MLVFRETGTLPMISADNSSHQTRIIGWHVLQPHNWTPCFAATRGRTFLANEGNLDPGFACELLPSSDLDSCVQLDSSCFTKIYLNVGCRLGVLRKNPKVQSPWYCIPRNVQAGGHRSYGGGKFRPNSYIEGKILILLSMRSSNAQQNSEVGSW